MRLQGAKTFAYCALS